MEKKLLHNYQYHVKPKSLEEIKVLVDLLKERGYKAYHGLDNALSLERLPVGLCIDNGTFDNGGKCIFQSTVTCMGCYVTWAHRPPLTVKDVIDNIVKLIDERNIEFYNKLLDEKTF